MRWSIRYQLLVPLLTLLLCVVVMSSWAAHASANQARKQMKQQVVRVIRTLRYSTFPLPQRVLELLKGFSGAEYVLVGKKDGLLTTMATPPEISRLNPADAENVELGERIVIDEIAYLYTGLELQRGPNRGDHVYIFYPEHAWRDALWEATWPSLLFGVFGGLVAIILTVLLSQRFTRRVQELESRTRLIAEGDFSPMTLPPSNDELRDLGLSINEMAGRLAEYQQAIQKNERLRLLGQLGGGLAHQLRNAVTGARLAVQLHDRECRQTTESREQGTGNREQRTGSREQGAENREQGTGNGKDRRGARENASQEPLDVALRQLAMVEMHLKQYLDLGKAGQLKLAPCSLSSLVDETVALLQPQCQHARITLNWIRPEDDYTIEADANHLAHLVLNLTTNAMEAAGPGGTVSVDLSRDDRNITVTVRDSGKGPTNEVAEHLFEPFVTGKPDGVGLGLAVAKQIVEAHGGKIRWERQDESTVFFVQLSRSETRVES